MLAKRFERRSKYAMKLLVTSLGLKKRMSWVLKMGDIWDWFGGGFGK
jgi:hypothetical protein